MSTHSDADGLSVRERISGMAETSGWSRIGTPSVDVYYRSDGIPIVIDWADGENVNDMWLAGEQVAVGAMSKGVEFLLTFAFAEHTGQTNGVTTVGRIAP